MTSDEARTRLGEAVRRRRGQLRLTIDEAAKLGQMSPTTWSRVENGLTVRGLTYAGIDAPMQWEAGGAEAILEGRGATPLLAPQPDNAPPIELVRELKARLDRIAAEGDEDDLQAIDRITRGMDPGDKAAG